MRLRDFFHSKARKTGHSEDWANYRCYRNRATNAIKKAKATYNRRLIDSSKDDPKFFWRNMKKILPGKRKDASPNISIGGNLISDKNLIAESFNKFFTSSVTQLLESVRSSYDYVRSFDQLSSVNSHLYPDFKFAEVSEASVGFLLRQLKTGKAVGLDNIPARLLVDSADIVAKPLTEIINMSLHCGVVPTE